MTSTDFQEVIEGPIRIAGAKIDDYLVKKMLEDLGDNPDQLPVLQHVLMRTWDYWRSHNDPGKPITNSDYEAVGMIEEALSEHANEAYDELDEREKQICESIFRTLTEKGGDNRGVRRPTKVKQLAEIAQASVEEVIKIVDVFRAHGRSFIVPSYKINIDENSVIDISHEAFMRIWERLRVWVDEEAAAVHMYKRLAESAAQYQQGKTSLWRPPDLQLAISWRTKTKPTLTWAERHDPAFERTMVFLETSEKEFQKEEENKIRIQKRTLRNTRIFALVLGGAAVVALGMFLYTRQLQQQAVAEKARADKNAADALQQKAVADSASQVAIQQRNVADSASQVAQKERENAVISADEAKRNAAEAQKQAEVARMMSDSAQKQSKIATTQSEIARQEQLRADSARQEADRRKMLSIAQSMAVKSAQMTTDTLLKGLLAFQAYGFNNEQKGVAYDPDIFKSAYSGLSFFEGANFNVYQGHGEFVRSITQDNDRFISGGSDGQVLSWNLSDKTSTLLLSNLPPVKRLIVKNPSLFCLTDSSLVKYDLSSKLSDSYYPKNFSIKDFFITKSGKYLLVQLQGIIIADDYKNPGSPFYKTDVKINVAKYDISSGNLFVALSDGKIFYWKNFQSETEKPVLLATIPNSNWGDISFNPQKNIVAAGTGNNQGAIYLWDITNGQQLSSLRGHKGKITGISFSSDGALMATASYDGSVRLWHMDDLNTLPIVFDDHAAWVTAIMFSIDNKYVISGARDGKLRRLPTQISTLIDACCNYLSRDLSQSEWQVYVGSDIPYKPFKCTRSQ
jgi:WD40 repeat protein